MRSRLTHHVKWCSRGSNEGNGGLGRIPPPGVVAVVAIVVVAAAAVVVVAVVVAGAVSCPANVVSAGKQSL